ncbi:unnamed protein product [Adineta steineri]|uniref:Uncharacterized protein n=2 Tax=Adineta steineri TaxID=433720 RepID=A0A813XUH4_9BILA|nr:unnamed protein product [Adineta steineri]
MKISNDINHLNTADFDLENELNILNSEIFKESMIQINLPNTHSKKIQISSTNDVDKQLAELQCQFTSWNKISIFGIICAMTFIVIVASHRQFHTLTIMLALNSAIAGIIVNVTCCCQAIYQLTSDGNDKLCSFRGFLLHAGAGLLYQTLCVQALHRLFVVVFATRRYLRSTKVMASITIIQ